MKYLLLPLLFCGFAASAQAKNLLVSIDGLVCVSCQPKVKVAFEKVKGVKSARVSTAHGTACLETEGDAHPNAQAFQASLVDLPEYKITKVAEIDTCPLDSKARRPGRLWSDTEGLDAQVISERDEVDLTTALVSGKFTFIDFGADWCGPCRVAEKKLKGYLSEHNDVAVRAIAMDGTTPEETFALPVAQQHLKNAAGLPHVLVFGPNGKQLYKGPSVDKALAIIDKRRAR